MDRSKGPINNINLLLELHHTTVKQSSDEYLVWLLGELHTSYCNKEKRCQVFSWASSKFHWTFSLNFLVMCAADDKTDFCILYTIHLILALSLTILLMFSLRCFECPPSTSIINVSWFTS